MKLYFYILCLSSLALALSSCGPAREADLVLVNGTIHTLDDTNPQAGAVAVKDDKIVFVGERGEADAWVGEHTQVIDLQNKTMTPGLIEGHGHFIEMG